MNQTVGSYVADDPYATAALGINAWDIGYNKLNDNGVGLAVEFSANSRQAIEYSSELLDLNGGSYYQTVKQELSLVDYNPSTPAKDPFPDNGGVWLDYYYPRDGNVFAYHGAFYNKIFVCSNGFIVLSHSDYYLDEKVSSWYGTPNLGSIAEPNTVIAPLWRDLDPSKDVNGDGVADGEIRAGWYYFQSSDYYVILWRVPNKVDNSIQEFAVLLQPMRYNYNANQPLGSFRFWYDTITSVTGTRAGLEDQFGRKTTYLAAGSDYNWKVTLADTADAKVIRDASILISKQYKDSSGNWVQDTGDSCVRFFGLDDLNSPAGTNLILEDQATDGGYTTDQWLSVGSWVLSTALLVIPPLAPLGVAGYAFDALEVGALALDTYLLSKELSPTDKTPPDSYSGVWGNGEWARYTPWTRMNAKDEASQQFYAWDIQFGAPVDWIVKKTAPDRARRLVVTGLVNYTNFDGSGRVQKSTSATIEIGKDPNSPAAGVNWLGRTTPDSHYFNFYPLATASTPYDSGRASKVGGGYHIDSNGSSDSGYDIFGWNRMTKMLADEYKVRGDGTIRVEGYFSMYDTLPSSERSAGRLVNIYVQYSDADRDGDIYVDGPNSIAKTVRVMQSSDALNTWKFYSTLITGLSPGKAVKIGIGRPDVWSTDYRITANWAGVRVVCRNSNNIDCWAVYVPPASSGGTTVPSTSTYCHNSWVGEDVGGTANGQQLSIATYPNSGMRFGWWKLSTSSVPNLVTPYSFTVTQDITITPNFISSAYKILHLMPDLGGTVSLSPSGTYVGSYLYLYTPGTSVKASARATTNYKFSNWLLDGVLSKANPITFTMNTDRTLQVDFVGNAVPT